MSAGEPGEPVSLQGGYSRTAIAAAIGRAIHLQDGRPNVFEDTMAMELAGEEGAAQMRELLDEIPEANLVGYGLAFAIRARVVEDAVVAAIAEGVRQYVILGAGLDSFAYRRGDLLGRLRVFEVDSPASQEWKRRRLADLTVEMPRGLVFVPIDFETQTLDEGLAAAGFDRGAPAVFSWIGVTQYLTREAMVRTLGAIVMGPEGTRVVFSYLVPRSSITNELEARGYDWIAARTVRGGEPFLSSFEPGQVEVLLKDLGFANVVDVNIEEARAANLEGYGDTRLVSFERLVVAVT